MRIKHELIGTVVEWRDAGYGFIDVPAVSDWVFLHRTALQNGWPKPGDRIRIDGAHLGDRGWRAEGAAELLED